MSDLPSSLDARRHRFESIQTLYDDIGDYCDHRLSLAGYGVEGGGYIRALSAS